MNMDYKEGFFNYRSKVDDNKLQLVRKKILIDETVPYSEIISDTNSTNNYEYETQSFYFLSEGDRFHFFISKNPTLFYVVSKDNNEIAEDLVFSKDRNKIEGEIIDGFLNSQFYEDKNIHETIKKHLDKTYKSFIMFRSFADRQFGNTVCFENLYGISKIKGEVYSDKMIDELLYLCEESPHNRWIKRDKRLQKILKKNEN